MRKKQSKKRPILPPGFFWDMDEMYYSFFVRYRKWFYVYIIILYVLLYFIDGELGFLADRYGYFKIIESWYWWSIFPLWFMVTGGYLMSITIMSLFRLLFEAFFLPSESVESILEDTETTRLKREGENGSGWWRNDKISTPHKISKFCWWLIALFSALYYPLSAIGLDFFGLYDK